MAKFGGLRPWACGLIVWALLFTPAAAWKPKTHVYLAEQATRDALDDGRVTIYETDYATGKIKGALGSFEVNPALLAAIRAKPAQYRAGVLGPDAYPDILTGQQLIHPGTNKSLLGSPADGELPSAAGADAWLTQLWRKAYGRQSLLQDATAASPVGGLIVPRNDTPAIRAFVAGYLTHAAGDMFMHTFVNHYAGGNFAMSPDPMNAVKHVVLEGYVGDRTPDFSAPVSIEGVDGFIYREMIAARPNSVLADRLLQGAGDKTSIPAIFSRLRNGLQLDVDRYDRERLSHSGPARVAYIAVNGPAAEYKKAWIEDIDNGLRAWPEASHKIAVALVYSETNGGVDVARAKAVAGDYVEDHLLSMAGTPDAVVATVAFINGIVSNILPPPLDALLAKIKRQPLEWMIEETTGKSLDEWASYLKDPAVNFDKVMNTPGGGYGGRHETLTTLADFNRDVLKIDDPGARFKDRRFKVEEFAPAFNTVQMTKLTFLSETGMSELLAALKAKGVDVATPWVPGKYENAMLGFLESLDGDNRWQGLPGEGDSSSGHAFFLARGDAAGWRHLFLRQIGERADWPAKTAPAQESAAEIDDRGFTPIDWWAVRLDGVTYDAAGGGSGRNVTIAATFRNDSGQALAFTDKMVRTLLDSRSGISAPALRMEYVDTEEASLPTWHYLPKTPIPPKGRIRVRYVYAVGEAVAQREVHLWTVIEQRPKAASLPIKFIDGPSKQTPVPRLNLDGTTGERPAAAQPQTATEPELLNALKAIEGVYLTNRDTRVTFTVDGANVIGKATARKMDREQLRLTLMADASLQGQWREDNGRAGVSVANLTIRFSPDSMRFAGKGEIPGGFSYDYRGERVAAESEGQGADGFKEAGYFALRLEAAGRVAGALAAPMEVAFTARNYLPGRRGLQYNDNRFTLMGSDGVEYKADGNFYGRSGAEKLNGTIWLEKDEQAAVTYIFPGVPPSVTATRLVVRDGDKVVGQFDVSATPTQRSAPPLAKPALGEPIAGQSVTLTQYQAGLVSLNPGGDGDWEGIMSFRNIATAPLKLWVGDIDVALRDAAGETRHNTGEFYFADRPGRQPNSNWMLVAVGAEVRVRLWFPHSAGLTPVQYAVREAGGEPKSMPIKFGPGGRLDLDGRVK